MVLGRLVAYRLGYGYGHGHGTVPLMPVRVWRGESGAERKGIRSRADCCGFDSVLLFCRWFGGRVIFFILMGISKIGIGNFYS